MRETPRATTAFGDYLAMPAGERSLERLVRRYQTATEAPPTKRLETLKGWSVAHGWQARIAGLAAKERENAEARMIEERDEVLSTGFALTHVRVAVLKQIAAREAAIARRTLAGISADPAGQRGRLLSRFQVMMVSLDKSLKSIAEETGGRVRRVSVQRDLEDYARQLAIERGYDTNDALALARMVARGES
jgi:hypothetical protein